MFRRGAINGEETVEAVGGGYQTEAPPRNRDGKFLFEFYCPDVADSARFQAPLKNPTWLNFWSNYFELNKHPARDAGQALSLSLPLLLLEARKGRTRAPPPRLPRARIPHAFVSDARSSGQFKTSDKSVLRDHVIGRSLLISRCTTVTG